MSDTVNIEIPEIISPARRTIRRYLFVITFLFTAGVGIVLFADFLWRTGLYGLRYGVLAMYVILFSTISFGFCMGLFGFLSLRGKSKTGRITATLTEEDDKPLPTTAIAIPIYNENVNRVFAGVRATYESLKKTGKHESFDIFVLSDSTNPDVWVEEEAQWLELCRNLNAFGRIFYRRRLKNTDKKSGNIHDFLTSWGSRYRYMVVFDADSVMTGDSLTKLVRLMEANPHTGIIQSVPSLFGGETVYARVLQFAARLYGRVFSAGLNYWQLSEGNYWGHNAIIRVKPFIDHCALPDLPYKEPLGGKILSHDFVEAALMRRGGYEVWLAYDLEGSYEEGPPNVIDSAQRDRRWCQGNLQHGWLLFSRELFGINRFHFFLGILAYANSLFWLLFLAMSTITVVAFERSGLTQIAAPGLTRGLDISITTHGLILLGISLLILFSPKIFALFDLLLNQERRKEFGGFYTACKGAITETLISAILAPILMVFHSTFIVFTLLGSGTSWGPQNRDSDKGVPLSVAILAHWKQTVLGIAWSLLAYIYSPSFFFWISPVTVSLSLSIPISMFLGSPKIGKWLRKQRVFLIPEEITPVPELQCLPQYTSENERYLEHQPVRGALMALMDPYINAIHLALLQKTDQTQVKPIEREERTRVVKEGLDGLSKADVADILADANAVGRIHRRIWHSPSEELSPVWIEHIRAFANMRSVSPRISRDEK